LCGWEQLPYPPTTVWKAGSRRQACVSVGEGPDIVGDLVVLRITSCEVQLQHISAAGRCGQENEIDIVGFDGLQDMRLEGDEEVTLHFLGEPSRGFRAGRIGMKSAVLHPDRPLPSKRQRLATPSIVFFMQWFDLETLTAKRHFFGLRPPESGKG